MRFSNMSAPSLALFLSIGCSAADPETSIAAPAERESQALSRASEYVDAVSSLTDPQQIEAWYAITRRLELEFDAVCGDTFCEGDYSNFQSLRFRCSVQQRTGKMGTCAWVFAASNEEVAPRDGAIRVSARSWQCAMPLSRGTALKEFLRVLSAASSALHSPLPGTSRTLYDGLLDCL